jgi:anti-sigma factor RsiW
MGKEQGQHPDESQIEAYSLGVLDEGFIQEFEQHLLTCHECQDRVAQMDAEVQGMQAAAREIRMKQALERSKAGASS